MQDSPNDLHLGQSHFIAEKIRASSDYQKFKDDLAKDYLPGETFENVKKGITLSSDRDLFLGINRATMTISGRFSENGELTDFRAQLYDIYDFDLLTGYHGKYGGYYGYGDNGYYYGYGTVEGGYGGYYYGKGLKNMVFGAAATVANNLAWGDQKLGILVPYKITVDVE